ncbi:DMT family transporter [Pedobacter alluvionis]|uniref:DMT family transporter n=1 Tax=Pedobacter alluvionis TaxID=475253 RepID=A0A497Y9P8_9SPHI|nr:DMT family transporter [Pedobacter alluvionis]RLJ80274.1 drug/metabolite transporter (DMT)-like permease [Pedobacter alluvionis]TFB31548.1 DMT family transporter [Pedobacter alluvionis]
MEKRNLFLILLILGTAFWGVSFPVTKLAIGQHQPVLFLFYRFLLATMVLSVIFWKHVKNIDANTIKRGAGLAIPLVLGIYLQTLGITHTSASQCSFVAGITVVMIPVIKLIIYKKAAALKIWIAACTALIGLFVISITDKFSIGTGDLYTIIGAFCFAIYLIQIEKESKADDIVPTIVPMFATCAILTFILTFIQGNPTWIPQQETFWIGIVFCALFSTAYMYTISNISQKYISAERVSIIYLFEPIFGAFAAHFILGEEITSRLLIGGGMIFLATLISELKWRMPGQMAISSLSKWQKD